MPFPPARPAMVDQRLPVFPFSRRSRSRLHVGTTASRSSRRARQLLKHAHISILLSFLPDWQNSASSSTFSVKLRANSVFNRCPKPAQCLTWLPFCLRRSASPFRFPTCASQWTWCRLQHVPTPFDLTDTSKPQLAFRSQAHSAERGFFSYRRLFAYSTFPHIAIDGRKYSLQPMIEGSFVLQVSLRPLHVGVNRTAQAASQACMRRWPPYRGSLASARR